MGRFTMALVSVVVFCASSASATFVKYEGLGYYQNVTYTFNSKQTSSPAGQIKLSLDNNPDPLMAYCVDLAHTVKTPWTASLQPVDLLGPTGDLVAFLYETFGPTVNSNVKGSALQVAIWDTVYDGDGDLSHGDFYLSGKINQAIAAQATMYLTSLPSTYTPASSTAILESGPCPRSQNMIVPDPATIILMLLGGLPFMRRREGSR